MTSYYLVDPYTMEMILDQKKTCSDSVAQVKNRPL